MLARRKKKGSTARVEPKGRNLSMDGLRGRRNRRPSDGSGLREEEQPDPGSSRATWEEESCAASTGPISPFQIVSASTSLEWQLCTYRKVNSGGDRLSGDRWHAGPLIHLIYSWDNRTASSVRRPLRLHGVWACESEKMPRRCVGARENAWLARCDFRPRSCRLARADSQEQGIGKASATPETASREGVWDVGIK